MSLHKIIFYEKSFSQQENKECIKFERIYLTYLFID